MLILRAALLFHGLEICSAQNIMQLSNLMCAIVSRLNWLWMEVNTESASAGSALTFCRSPFSKPKLQGEILPANNIQTAY